MRLRKLKNKLRKEQKFPYLVSDLINIKYLTGFKGTYAYLLIDDKKAYFISDSRYAEYACSILPKSIEFVLMERGISVHLKELVKSLKHKELNLEEHTLSYSNFLLFKKELRGIKLLPGGSLVNELRTVKEDGEIAILKDAAQLTDKCIEHLKQYIKPGITEWDIAVEIEYYYRKNKCTKSSFDSIVASGKGASMPHYQTSMDKRVQSGDVLLIDMGCVYEGYNSDLTRTLFLHSIDPFIQEIYSIVLEAQIAAVEAVRPGITVGELDSIARNIIREAGYGEHFGHALGHGCGLEVHELPAVKSGSFQLRKNMVITVEPGIYVPGKGGVRIEDMVLVTARGQEILTPTSKEITVI